MDRDKPVYIEFFGLPASGKSTIVEALLPELEKKGIKCSDISSMPTRGAIRNAPNPVKNVLKLFIYCIRNPHFSWSAIKYGLRVNPFSFQNLWLSFKMINMSLFIKENMNQTVDAVIFEEGLHQNLWSFGAFGESRPIDKMIDCIGEHMQDLKYHLVFIKPDVNLSIDRIESSRHKRNSRFDEISDKTYLFKVLKQGAERANEIIEKIPDDVSVLTLSASDSVTDNVNRIITWYFDSVQDQIAVQDI